MLRKLKNKKSVFFKKLRDALELDKIQKKFRAYRKKAIFTPFYAKYAKCY